MKKLLLASLALALAGCSGANLTANINAIEGDLQRLQAGVTTIEGVAQTFCPSLQAVQVTAQTIACTAHANNTTQAVIAKAIAAGNAFCTTPAATTMAALNAQVQAGVIAVSNAKAAGCIAQ